MSIFYIHEGSEKLSDLLKVKQLLASEQHSNLVNWHPYLLLSPAACWP